MMGSRLFYIQCSRKVPLIGWWLSRVLNKWGGNYLGEECSRQRELQTERPWWGTCLACLNKSKEARYAEQNEQARSMVDAGVNEVTGSQTRKGFVDDSKEFAFYFIWRYWKVLSKEVIWWGLFSKRTLAVLWDIGCRKAGWTQRGQSGDYGSGAGDW